MLDLVSLGECLVEIRKDPNGNYSQSYAGDVFNTLFYASRLGLRTGFISQFGADHFTAGLLELCAREHIDVSACKAQTIRPNGIYLIKTVEGQPSYSFWRKGSAATMTLAENETASLAQYILSSRHFLFSAIGLAVFKEIEKLFDLLTVLSGKVRVYFDMNVRPSLWEDISILEQHVERLAQSVDVIFVSSSDDKHVFGDRSAEEAIAWFRDAGYPSIIYRDGDHPTLGWTKKTGMAEVQTVQDIRVIDATGAGDAFNAGFIYASEGSFEDAIRMGNVCGALAVHGVGGQVTSFNGEEVMRQFNHKGHKVIQGSTKGLSP